MTQEGVKVTCADGSVCEGSIVMGADGVHSKTRQLMCPLALREDLTRSWDAEQPYTATYQLLFGSSRRRRPPAAATTSKNTRYTDKDVQSVTQEFFEFPLTQTTKVKDVWSLMRGAGLTNLDEGIVQHWSLGRVVLVGDACHKMTTHLGLSFNNGVQNVVVLCNKLRKVVDATPKRLPNAHALTDVFEMYQAMRMSSSCSLKGDV
ncbi:hypothetical protein SEUCBS140593_001596 [Sporothrix eucalyptigena]|uniref:FAD-binding domain-containing protein n=1 Tax=Sporothrix eucalyptigena TaxID=1812306 RepID=A0ABP0AZI1_9PEZI